ncbi:NmrA family NAD(P)-binding protein [Streptomyces sp. NPDC005374]|uniref:NmrA family NAD(P)-binding protein n=1 Tax=Streptomyces sp. NPDC005374 TaxID=3364713 RepID=UPI0036C00C88
MNALSNTTVLVTGAAGDQGVATVRHLLEAGHTVRAFDVADPDSPRPQYLRGLGAEYVQGDLADSASIDKVMTGAEAVFAVPVGAPGSESVKTDNAARLIEGAERADVGMFVQTTVAGLERHLVAGDFGTGHHADEYAAARLKIEARLRTSTLERWVVLRPVTLMENFLPPKAYGMFPWLAEGRLDSVHAVGVPVQLVSVVDIARFTVAALREPERFDRQIIELIADELPLEEVATSLSDATGSRITYQPLSVPRAVEAGMRPGVAHSQEWANRIGYGAPSADALHKAWGIAMTPFAEWARAHADTFDVPH